MKLDTRFSWTNWTFGFWWARRNDRLGGKGKLMIGVDIGPLELIWRDMREAKR